ncbi:tyrosine-type recombinase/integrase [Trichocoleus sp. DQ-A3]|uniref:tyrosine-type recombinase/integrase n=1 Tax=Cyanophyceae TaxID=3028117 RepID=UPI001683D902|nr:tyrosine-type recombinase/integrase [Coleofasciculus sp. FACHB-125]MBD1903688.1 tyrosine-type recombinase/integrase [Coleofasciculus sp. FACHB-125]
MKIDRHGKAKILSQTEIQLLFSQGLQTERDRCLFAVALFSACRINEACTLLTQDVYDTKRRVRPNLLIRKANTKGQLETRTIPIIEDLRSILITYQPVAGAVYLFPGRFNDGHINPDSAARILRKAAHQVGIEGASTHSFRRTALTQMSNAGIPLRVIAAYSGHRDLSQLSAYLEVRDEQILGAAATLSMLSPIIGQVGKHDFPDLHHYWLSYSNGKILVGKAQKLIN